VIQINPSSEHIEKNTKESAEIKDTVVLGSNETRTDSSQFSAIIPGCQL
jgi:hypothetical protein